jgi:simple sugar transport system permease protein
MKEFSKNIKKIIGNMIRYPLFGAVVAFSGIFLFFYIAKPKLFLTGSNFAAIFTVSTELGIVAVGTALLMISGEFDLSVGSVFGLSSILLALLANSGISSVLSLFIVLAIALVIGFVNGLITVKGGVPSFITTLGMMMFVRGIMLLRTGGWNVIFKSKDTVILTILNGKIIENGFLRWSIAWFVLFNIFFFVLLGYTKYGNHIYAVGGNKLVAKYVGVNVDKVKISAFCICSLLAGFGGAVNMGRFTGADSTTGTGMELETITACVIGGILLTGGYGNILGVFLGAVLISATRSGLILIGVPGYFYTGVLGILLIITAYINIIISKKVLISKL